MRRAPLAILAVLAADVRANTPDEARGHFERGKALYEAHDYRKAVEEYVAAYKLAPFPELVFDIGQAHRLAGNDAEALFAYEQYLAQEPTGDLAAEARAHALELRNRGITPSKTIAKDGWGELSARLDASDRDERDRAERDRRRVLVGAGLAFANVARDKTFDVDASLAYSYRLNGRVAFEPRIVVGIAVGGDRAAGTPFGELQLAMHLYAARWFYASASLGVGFATCATGQGLDGCDGGAIVEPALGLGFVVSSQLELRLALNVIPFIDDGVEGHLSVLGASLAWRR